MLSITAIRDLTGLTQREFAGQYHIPYSTLQKWEQGKRKCPEYTLELLERVVRIDLREHGGD